MGPRLWGLAGGALLLLVAPAALAQSVHEIQAGGDTVTGTISDAADVDRVPFRLPKGAVVTLSVKADKGGLLHPAVVLLGTDREPDTAAAAAFVTASKGNAVTLKSFAVASSGLRWLEIRGADGTTGNWTLAMKVKLPKKAAGTGTTAGGAGAFPFVNPGGATATLAVSAGKGSAALPEFQRLENPDGAPVLADLVNPTTKGFVIAGILLGPSGDWTLRFTTDADGTFVAKASFKIPKPFKRTLVESQVITDPVLVAVDPSSADIAQTLTVTLEVDFAEPGAIVTFRRSPTVVTLTGTQLVHGPGTIASLLIVGSFVKGSYGVDVVNADGGKDSLENAFTVNNAPARPTAVIPTWGHDDEEVTLTITGTFLLSGATARLVRGAETIPGTGLGGSSSLLTGQFDLRGRTQGLWDLEVTNPDTTAATLSSAFEIRNAPPGVTAFSPGSDRSGSAFTGVVTGAEFEATPTALLRRTGEADIAASSVTFVNGSLVRADFDTTGADPGARDLVVTNPDGQAGTLAEAFWVGGVAGPPVTSFTRSFDMDGPPALVWNPSRNEFAVAWVETYSGNYDVYVRRLDAQGRPVGAVASVSPSASSVSKRDVALAWNSTSDEYLVAWSEYVSSPGYHQVFVRRVASTDLTFPAAPAQVSDHTLVSGWYIDNFHNYRPTVAWNPSQTRWEVAWMQEWSASGDDYDVLLRSWSPGSGALGGPVAIAISPYHEGDPCAAWDSAGGQLIVAYAGEAVSSGPMEIYVGTGTSGTRIVSSTGSNLVDPRVAVDPTNRRLLLTWTVLPNSGNRTVQAVMGDATSVGTAIGTPATVGETGDDDFLARPLYSASLGEGTIAWTRLASGPSLAVMGRRVDTSGTSGLSFLESEKEISGGSGDEACPAVASKEVAKETAFFWLKGLTLSSTGSYSWSVVPGVYRGKDLLVQRFR